MIPQQVLDAIEKLKKEGNYDEALKIVNKRLTQDPLNQEGLYQVADIEYRRGEISKAEKPVDFLLHGNESDPMGWYIKGVLEMEKTNRPAARSHFKKSIQLLEDKNPEILRCYAMCEYRSGNREIGLRLMNEALETQPKDCEIIVNLIEMLLLESSYEEAQEKIHMYLQMRSSGSLDTYDNTIEEYDERVGLYQEYLASKSTDAHKPAGNNTKNKGR